MRAPPAPLLIGAWHDAVQTIKMIDFAHVDALAGGAARDESYITGLRSLLRMLGEARDPHGIHTT